MHRVLLALLLVLSGGAVACAEGEVALPARTPEATTTAYAADVRRNFLDSCLENATRTAEGSASREQLVTTCECILGRVEQEYTQAGFAAFEKRLLGGMASDAESKRLVGWSTDCAREASQ